MTATYDVAVDIGWDTRVVKVDTTIDITNTSGGPVGRLLLNTTAPAIGAMRLGRVAVDGQRVTPRVTGQTIAIRLPETLVEDGSVRVRVAYTGRAGLSTAGHDWMWAKGNDVLNLYRIIPWLSKKVPFQRDNHGDPFVTPTSPEVRVAITADRKLIYATSGVRVAVDGRTQTFVARDVRDFNITASPSYTVRSQRTKDGETLVRVYTVNGRGELLMKSALNALRAYEAWIGPYPWPVFNVAESAGGYAMESPALIWMPMEKFTDADVRYITAHETGHQWFYGVVGNDQSTDMFADEAMTDFISRRLVDRIAPATVPRTASTSRCISTAAPATSRSSTSRAAASSTRSASAWATDRSGTRCASTTPTTGSRSPATRRSWRRWGPRRADGCCRASGRGSPRSMGAEMTDRPTGPGGAAGPGGGRGGSWCCSSWVWVPSCWAVSWQGPSCWAGSWNRRFRWGCCWRRPRRSSASW